MKSIVSIATALVFGLGYLAPVCGDTATPPRKPVAGAATRTVYLTFDGGPSQGFSARVLPVLKKHNCKATFFVVGQYLTADPAAAGELVRAGHEVESHTWTHPHLPRLTDDEIRRELTLTAEAIRKQTGRSPEFMRPPFGQHDARVDAIASSLGQKIAMWNVTCRDWAAKDPDEIVRKITKQMKPDAVVLLHVCRPTWKALPKLLERLDAMGYRYALLKDRPARTGRTKQDSPPKV